MPNAFITKGSLVTLGSGSTEIKAVVIEDFEIGVGQATNESTGASDGTKYNFRGEDEDSTVSIPLISRDDNWDDILTSAYGSPSVTGSKSVWDLRIAGNSNTVLQITSPTTTDTVQLKYIAVNPRALGIAPRFILNKGFEGVLNVVLDYWQAQIDTSP